MCCGLKEEKVKKDESWVKVNQQGMQAPKGCVQGWERQLTTRRRRSDWEIMNLTQ